MDKTIKVDDRIIEYQLKVNFLARRVIIRLSRNGQVTVTKPERVSEVEVEAFVRKQSDWIISKRNFLKRQKNLEITLAISGSYKDNKARARLLALDLIERYNQDYQFTYSKLTIRNQKTRWGSCSQRGNLNFNYRILFLPPTLADYLIVHELCHRRQFNHTKEFWKLVERTIPDYRKRRDELKRINIRRV